MGLILKLILFLVASLFIRRAIGRLISPKPTSPPPREGREKAAREESGPPSGKHPAIGEDEVIEEGEFEELD